MEKLSKEEKYALVEKYEIDLNKLSRNFIEEPLKVGLYNRVESPTLQDIEYLYLTLNLSIPNLSEFFSTGIDSMRRILNSYSIRKDLGQVLKSCNRTIKEKYGVDNISQKESIKEKKKQTCLKNHGVEYNLQDPKTRERAKQVYLERWGVEYNSQAQEVKEKKKQTCLNHFGVENPLQSEEVKEKIKQSNIEKYGVDFYTQTEQMKEKSKQTCIEKYGVEYSLQSEEVREKGKKTNLEKFGCEYSLQSKEVREKGKRTIREKYGVDNPGQSEVVKEKMRKTCIEKYGVPNVNSLPSIKEKKRQTCLNRFGVEYAAQNKEIQEKQFNTRKKNNSFNNSKEEERIYEILLEKFSEVIRQYRDNERYPFACDFYIPTLDLFIEYQGTWTHGFHPFDENNPKDLEEKSKWLQKANEVNFKGNNKNYYLQAIHTWTVTDVEKRNVAKANGLNWIEFFSLRDFVNWFEEQK